MSRFVIHGLYRLDSHECEDAALLGLPSLDSADMQEPNCTPEEVLDGRRTALFTAIRYTQNLAAAGLYHLWEKQARWLLGREILLPSAYVLKHKNRSDNGNRWKVDVQRADFQRLAELFLYAGWDISSFKSYPSLSTLNQVSNTIKHGGGKSCDLLYKGRRDLFWPRSDDLLWFDFDLDVFPGPDPFRLDVRESHYREFAQSVHDFWDEVRPSSTEAS